MLKLYLVGHFFLKDFLACQAEYICRDLGEKHITASLLETKRGNILGCLLTNLQKISTKAETG